MTVGNVRCADILIALGSNLGDRESHLATALEKVARLVRVTGASRVYETEPWGYSEQPRFLNAVIRGTTGALPLDLLAGLKHIEHEMGRTATFRNGPRVIDLDILNYDCWVYRSSRLELPHSHMHERLFVLQPLCDVAPEWRHPTLFQTAAEMRDILIAEGEKPPRAVYVGRLDSMVIEIDFVSLLAGVARMGGLCLMEMACKRIRGHRSRIVAENGNGKWG